MSAFRHRITQKGSNRFSLGLTAPLKAAFLGATIMLSPIAASANDASVQNASLEKPTQCSTLLLNQHGFEMGAGANALKFSDDNKGSVGIAVYPGKDMNGYTPDQIGLYLGSLFEGQSVDAKCFIAPANLNRHTGILYNVNGLSWTESGSLNLQQATDGTTVDGIVAEAKTGKLLLSSASSSPSALNP